MKNKFVMIGAALLLSAVAAFAYFNYSTPCCDNLPDCCQTQQDCSGQGTGCCNIPCCQ